MENVNRQEYVQKGFSSRTKYKLCNYDKNWKGRKHFYGSSAIKIYDYMECNIGDIMSFEKYDK